MKDNRYQAQPWYIKLWRRRLMMTVPYDAVRLWYANMDNEWPLSLVSCWKIAVGSAHIRMNWVYTWEECTLNRLRK